MDLMSIIDLLSIKKYAAEFIGTFVLAFTVSLSLAGQFPVPTGFLAALALGIGVYIVGAYRARTSIRPSRSAWPASARSV